MPGFSERPWARGWLLAFLPILSLALGGPRRAGAQVISPGHLAEAHRDLEGIGNCTSCHRLGSRGVDPVRCLSCHQALGRRIEERKGFHGRLEEKDCGTCHVEHLGTDAPLIRLDADTFPHSSTGYTLEGAHTALPCRTCHTRSLVSDEEVIQELSGLGGLDRTFLGLSQECAACHSAENPHSGQFGDRSCGTCHTAERPGKNWYKT